MVGFDLAGGDLQQRRFARTVAADQADALAGSTEVGALQQRLAAESGKPHAERGPGRSHVASNRKRAAAIAKMLSFRHDARIRFAAAQSENRNKPMDRTRRRRRLRRPRSASRRDRRPSHDRLIFADDPGPFRTLSRRPARRPSLRLFEEPPDPRDAAPSVRPRPRRPRSSAGATRCFRGEKVNATEGRAALHMALRNFSGAPVLVDGEDVMPAVEAEREKVAAFATRRARGRDLSARAATRLPTSSISASAARTSARPWRRARCRPWPPGPARAFRLQCRRRRHRRHAGRRSIRRAPCSSSRRRPSPPRRPWPTPPAPAPGSPQALGEAAVGDHFAAVSTKLDKVADIRHRRRTASSASGTGSAGAIRMWSAIGLSLAIAIGPSNFEEFLRGGYDVDQHFRDAPLARNIPVLMGLIGVWHRNVWGFAPRPSFPTTSASPASRPISSSSRWRSNGKACARRQRRRRAPPARSCSASPAPTASTPSSSCCTRARRSIPVDFLVAAQPTDADDAHHACCSPIASPRARRLCAGASAEGSARHPARAGPERRGRHRRLAPHKVFPATGRPSTFLYRALDSAHARAPRRALRAQGVRRKAVIWDINPFDQWGVELGKELASLAPLVSDASADLSGLDGSTAGLVAHLRELRGTSDSG